MKKNRLLIAVVVGAAVCSIAIAQQFQHAKPMIVATFRCDAASPADTCYFKVFMSNGTGMKYFAIKAHTQTTISGLLEGDPYIVMINQSPPDQPDCSGAHVFCATKSVHAGVDN
ncbi:hypothetical protein BZM26_10015 [Paraburkholderia strydomiana]|nr:hypothetical protein BZM26_10015 [Paraburkholderia strydomiana]